MQLEKKRIEDANWTYVVNHLPSIDLRTGPWIAGGSARRLWMNQDWTVGDIDVFFSDDLSRHLWHKQLVETWPLKPELNTTVYASDVFSLSDGTLKQKPRQQNTEFRDLTVVMDTDNATTLNLFYQPDGNSPLRTVVLQLIKARYSASIIDLWKDFDFTISCFAASAYHVWGHRTGIQDAHNKQIRLNNADQKQNLAMRLVKHHAQGFKIDDQLLMQAVELIAQGEVKWTTQY